MLYFRIRYVLFILLSVLFYNDFTKFACGSVAPGGSISCDFVEKQEVRRIVMADWLGKARQNSVEHDQGPRCGHHWKNKCSTRSADEALGS